MVKISVLNLNSEYIMTSSHIFESHPLHWIFNSNPS